MVDINHGRPHRVKRSGRTKIAFSVYRKIGGFEPVPGNRSFATFLLLMSWMPEATSVSVERKIYS